MEVLTINGKQFTKAANVAKEFGYAPDYVGQLARSGAVQAERVGRAWYVDRDEVALHKKEKRRSVAARARAGLVERVRVVEHVGESVRNIPKLSYQEDDEPLMPKIVPSGVVSVRQTEEAKVAEGAEVDGVFMDEFDEIPEPEVTEESEVVTESYRVPIRQENKVTRIEMQRERAEIPYGGYEVSQKKEITAPTFSAPSTPYVAMEKHSSVPYVLLLSFSMIVLFVGMYTYVDGVVTSQSTEKTYGVSVDVVNKLMKKQ